MLTGLAMPFEAARIQLWHGERLRRARRPTAARTVLRAALSVFEGLGATPWARRASAELVVAGERAQPSPRALPLNRLTPQELQVAQHVAGGMNNAEAAAALFMSRKTVEAHLTRTYRKLGIRSRSDLARMLASAGLQA